MADFNMMFHFMTTGLQALPVEKFAPYFFGTVLVLGYQLLRSQKRKLIRLG